MSGMEVSINIEDWHREALATETPIKDVDTILELLEQGMHSGQVARMAVVWREKGEAPDGLINPNKTLLYVGAQDSVTRLVQRQRHKVDGKNGQTFEASSYVGAVSEGQEDGGMEQSYVRHDDKRAIERAQHYLASAVPGHVWGRLLLIYENGGDVKAASRQLKREIDEMVKKLV